MNLHALARGAIGSVNPFVQATVRMSTGYTTAANGSRTPTYVDKAVSVQVQALSYSDLTLLDSLKIQGVRRTIYTDGAVAGIVRDKNKGGDLIRFAPGTLPEGDVWLVAQVLEQWPSWCKLAITLQNGT